MHFNNFTLNYDAENRLVSVTGAATATFDYDGDGKQVKATVNGVTTVYIGNHYEVKNGTATKYYFAGATRLAVRTNGTLSYLLSDHLGSSSVTTDANGVKTASALYKAFGETRYTLGNLGTDYKFTGQREEASLGIYFFNARFYDPSIGRFIQPDSIIPYAAQGTQAWDRYGFVNNNPVRYTDPTGHCLGPTLILCIVAVVVIVALVGDSVVNGTKNQGDTPEAYQTEPSGLNYHPPSSTPTPAPTNTPGPSPTLLPPNLNPSTSTPYPTDPCNPGFSGHCFNSASTYTPGPTYTPTSTSAPCYSPQICPTPTATPTVPTVDPIICALYPSACPTPVPTNTSTSTPTNTPTNSSTNTPTPTSPSTNNEDPSSHIE